MMFDWTQYLGFAQDLIGDAASTHHGDEAKFRAAVSRAYYAAHGMAREKLLTEGYKLPVTGRHAWVIEQFKNSKDSDRHTIASRLTKLKDNRVKADYIKDSVIQKGTARFVNKLAKEVIDSISTL